jgi:hypothetical protein
MKTRILFFIAVIFTFLALPSMEAQTKKRLAILPFSGGQGQDGETISILLSNQRVLLDAFTVQPRNSAIDKIMGEQKYQRQSGLINSDAISEIGKLNTADLVVSGYITKLSDQNLVLISIIDVTEVQQIAGVYQVYRSIEEIRGVLPGLARRLAESSKRNYNNLPALAVPSFSVPKNVNANDAMVLAQILATEIVNLNKYAVFPRNSSVDDVLKEHQFQRSGQTSGAVNLGTSKKIDFILSSNVMSLGKSNLFGSQIINIERGDVISGADREYQTISDGLNKDLMKEIAGELLSVSVISPNTPATTAAATTTTAPAPAAAGRLANSDDIISSAGGWRENSDDRSSSDISIGLERIDGRERSVLTIEINLAGGTPRWAGASLYNMNIIQDFKYANGVRFKVLGDGKKWIVNFPTSNITDNAFHRTTISTQNGRVSSIDIPYRSLKQPEWGRNTVFNKNNLTGISIERQHDMGGAGRSAIKIFDFEIY